MPAQTDTDGAQSRNNLKVQALEDLVTYLEYKRAYLELHKRPFYLSTDSNDSISSVSELRSLQNTTTESDRLIYNNSWRRVESYDIEIASLRARIQKLQRSSSQDLPFVVAENLNAIFLQRVRDMPLVKELERTPQDQWSIAMWNHALHFYETRAGLIDKTLSAPDVTKSEPSMEETNRKQPPLKDPLWIPRSHKQLAQDAWTVFLTVQKLISQHELKDIRNFAKESGHAHACHGKSVVERISRIDEKITQATKAHSARSKVDLENNASIRDESYQINQLQSLLQKQDLWMMRYEGGRKLGTDAEAQSAWRELRDIAKNLVKCLNPLGKYDWP